MKKFKPRFIYFFWCLLGLISAQFLTFSNVSAESCQLSNVYLEAMPKGEIKVTIRDNETLVFEVKTAQNNRTRSAGFQRVCASTIAAEPILFVFAVARVPSFHMNNVVAPIDIAFIDGHGRIESIQSMFPYVLVSKERPLYSPSRAVVAALEVYPGFYQEHGINVGDLVEWKLPDATP